MNDRPNVPSGGARPLRIWHVNVGNHAGAVCGVGVASARLASEQADAGHDVRLVVAADPCHHEGIRATVSEALQLILADSSTAALREARRLLGDPAERPDVVHLHSVFRPMHRLLAGRARRLGIPVVLSAHAGLAPVTMRRDRLRKSVYGALVERRHFRAAEGVHALHRIEQEDLVAYSGRTGPVEIIPNPVDRTVAEAEPWRVDQTETALQTASTATGSSAHPAGGSPEATGGGPPRVLGRAILLCRYDVYTKGLDRLAAMARARPDIEFDVHGTTDKNQPERAAALMASAPDNLRFLPPVHGRDKLDRLRAADLFLLPSRVEGLSLAMVEAMTLGLPCAVSSYVGRALAMRENGTGLVLSEEPTVAGGQLAVLLTNRARLSALGAAGREFARRHFAPDQVVDQHVTHYGQLLNRS